MDKRGMRRCLNKYIRSSRVASTETVSRLLGQAVRSGDRTLLEEALRVRKENVIKQTIKRLPVSLILPLLKQVNLSRTQSQIIVQITLFASSCCTAGESSGIISW